MMDLGVGLFALNMLETCLAFSLWKLRSPLLPQPHLCPFFKQKQCPSVLGGRCPSVLVGGKCLQFWEISFLDSYFSIFFDNEHYYFDIGYPELTPKLSIFPVLYLCLFVQLSWTFTKLYLILNF